MISDSNVTTETFAAKCRLTLFQDSDFVRDLEDTNSTSRKNLSMFGSRFFVPKWDVQEVKDGLAQFLRVRGHILRHWITYGRHLRCSFWVFDYWSFTSVFITHEYGEIRCITFVVVCVKHPRIRTKLKASTSDESWLREIDYVAPSARLSHHNALLHFWWQWSSEKRWSSKAELRRRLFSFGSSKSWLQNGSKVTPTSRKQPDFNNFDEYWFRILSIHVALVIIWVIAQSTADAVAADITSFVRLSDSLFARAWSKLNDSSDIPCLSLLDQSDDCCIVFEVVMLNMDETEWLYRTKYGQRFVWLSYKTLLATRTLNTEELLNHPFLELCQPKHLHTRHYCEKFRLASSTSMTWKQTYASQIRTAHFLTMTSNHLGPLYTKYLWNKPSSQSSVFLYKWQRGFAVYGLTDVCFQSPSYLSQVLFHFVTDLSSGHHCPWSIWSSNFCQVQVFQHNLSAYTAECSLILSRYFGDFRRSSLQDAVIYWREDTSSLNALFCKIFHVKTRSEIFPKTHILSSDLFRQSPLSLLTFLNNSV